MTPMDPDKLKPSDITFEDFLNAARAQGIQHALDKVLKRLLLLETGTIHMLKFPGEDRQREGARMAFDGMRSLIEQEFTVLRQQYAKELAMASDAFLKKVGPQTPAAPPAGAAPAL